MSHKIFKIVFTCVVLSLYVVRVAAKAEPVVLTPEEQAIADKKAAEQAEELAAFIEANGGVYGFTDSYDYAKEGKDWDQLVDRNGGVNYCAFDDSKKQSPINLMQPYGSYGRAYGLPIPKWKDSFKKTYSDLTEKVKVKWARTAPKIYFDEVEQESNFFTSNYGRDNYGAKGTKFTAKQFHLHSPSEHTVNGKHFDLEMHIVHALNPENTTEGFPEGYKESNIQYAVVGLLFSVENFDKSISIPHNESTQLFIEHLKLNDLDEPYVDRISLGSLMETLDLEHRWVYHGSLTTPPCTPVVYWNVLQRILPIKYDEYERVKAMLEHRKGDLKNTINNRPIQPIINQNVHFIGAKTLSQIASVLVSALSVSSLLLV